MGNRAYDSTHTRQISLKLNIRTDKDILDYLDTRDNKQGYIKMLVRRDIELTTMRTFEILSNLKNWDSYDFKSYPLKKREAEVCIAALEKATPKKYKMDIDRAVCPECGSEIECQSIIEGEILYHQQFEYCPNCGQAIDWEV